MRIVSSRFHLETLMTGDYFLKTGMPCNKPSYIKSGLLRIYKQTEDKEATPAMYCLELLLPIVIRIHNQILMNQN